MKKQPELTAMTRKSLIDTYFEIAARGEKATVGTVAEQAHFNRCTFYRYFTDIDHLLYEVETEICDAFRSALSQRSPSTTYSEMIESLVAVYKEHGHYLHVLLGKHGDLRFVSRMKALIYPMASQMFAATSDSSVAAELKIEFVLSAVLATVTKWYEMGQPIPIDQLGILIMELLQNNVLGTSFWSATVNSAVASP